MSSACVCHIEGEWCFYCEMYSPLERQHERILVGIKSLIHDLDEIVGMCNPNVSMQLTILDAHYVKGIKDAHSSTIQRLREVIAQYAPDNSGNAARDERDTEREQ